VLTLRLPGTESGPVLTLRRLPGTEPWLWPAPCCLLPGSWLPPGLLLPPESGFWLPLTHRCLLMPHLPETESGLQRMLRFLPGLLLPESGSGLPPMPLLPGPLPGLPAPRSPLPDDLPALPAEDGLPPDVPAVPVRRPGVFPPAVPEDGLPDAGDAAESSAGGKRPRSSSSALLLPALPPGLLLQPEPLPSLWPPSGQTRHFLPYLPVLHSCWKNVISHPDSVSAIYQ